MVNHGNPLDPPKSWAILLREGESLKILHEESCHKSAFNSGVMLSEVERQIRRYGVENIRVVKTYPLKTYINVTINE